MRFDRLIGIVICCLLLAGCGTRITKRISMGMVDGWAEGTAMVLVTQQFLSEKGYHVVTQKAAPNLLLASMDNGDTDVFMDVWLPTTHGEKVARFNRIFSAGTNYEGTQLGLVVPDYVTIDSIGQLNANSSRFDGKIIGIERGSGIATSTDAVIAAYNLDYEQMNSSTVAMITELQKAVDENRWIVITGWQPHWLFGRFDLKFLKDPQNIYGEAEHIETFVREGFDQDFPEVYQYLQRVFFDEALMADLLLKMEGSKNEKETAQQWVVDHRELLESWWQGSEG